MNFNSWQDFIKQEFQKEYYNKLVSSIKEDEKQFTIYPPNKDIFNAFKFCPLDKVKVIIFGQDPYHGPGQAHGLSFSVNKDCTIPPSLKNIYKELVNDLGITYPTHGCLSDWAKQGVLLLNSSLTVREGQPNSHSQFGWQTFTDNVIKLLNDKNSPIVFILWGSFARKKKELISNKNHLILESVHPSPLSVYNGFFGSKPFSKTNDFFIKNNQSPIDWSIK